MDQNEFLVYITEAYADQRRYIRERIRIMPCRSYFHRLTFRHRASCILGQAFRYSPENTFYIFNQ